MIRKKKNTKSEAVHIYSVLSSLELLHTHTSFDRRTRRDTLLKFKGKTIEVSSEQCEILKTTPGEDLEARSVQEGRDIEKQKQKKKELKKASRGRALH